MTLVRPDYVIFDMDGTAVRHINPRILNLLERLDDYSFKIGGWVEKLTGFRGKKRSLSGIVSRDKKKKLLVHKALHRVRSKDVEQIVEPCPGIYPVLDFLSQQNIPMAIASNGLGKGYGHEVLKTFDLEPYFQVTIFREDILKAKPHPESLLKVTNNFTAPPKNHQTIWYIGDRWKDIQAAWAAEKELKCSIIPFAYGLNATLHAFVEGKLSPPQRILDYEDLLVTLRFIFEQPPDGEKLLNHSSLAPD